MANPEAAKIQTEARDLVIRSRLGDENATAMLVMIRNSAAAGSRRAIYTLKYLKSFIDKHPMTGKCKIGFGCDPITQRIINSVHSHMAGDPDNHAQIVIRAVPKITNPNLAAVSLANNGDLISKGMNNPRIKAICALLTEPEVRAFQFGCANCFMNTSSVHGELDDAQLDALHIGKAVGIAQRIQGVRNFDDVPIATLSKMAAWELGED